ncbi:hypothetical protein CR513_40896, partial [Mucuna pruriens]
MDGAVSKVSGDLKSSSFDRIRPPPPPPPDSSLVLVARPPRHLSHSITFYDCSFRLGFDLLNKRCRTGRARSFVQFALLLEWFSVTRSGDELSVGLPRCSRNSAET